MVEEKVTLDKIKESIETLDVTCNHNNDLSKWYRNNEGLFEDLESDVFLKKFRKIQGDYQSELIISRYCKEYIHKIYKTNTKELLFEILHYTEMHQEKLKKNSIFFLLGSRMSKILFPLILFFILGSVIVFIDVSMDYVEHKTAKRGNCN